jgi:archaetidylinositol phosphate synthase
MASRGDKEALTYVGRDTMLRSRFDTEKLSIRLGLLFARFGISPNVWTLLSLLPAVCGFLVLAFYGKYPENLFAGLFLFVVSGFLDAVDGAVARVTSRVSALGAFLDGVIDRYVEILLYMGLYFFLADTTLSLWLPNTFWISFLIFGALMPTFIRAYADHRKVVTDASALRAMGGLLERAERLTLVYLGMFLGAFDIILLIYILAATSILTNYTALQRLWFVVKYAKSK